MRLNNKIVLVTGGSTGLGEAICYEAAKQGAIVIVSARRMELIQKVKDRCQVLSQKEAYAFPVDLESADSIKTLIQSIKETVGVVDIVVNNAGFGIFEDFIDFDLEKARKMFEVNLFGMMYLTQALAIDM